MLNKYIAETIGTFAMILFGCGAMVVNDLFPNTLGHTGVAAAWGGIVMIMIYAVGNISGAHFNPAVTLGFFFAKRLDAKEITPYIISQLIGAFGAAALLLFLFPSHETLGATIPSIDVSRAFVVEVILSFVLMFVILNISTDHMEKGIMAGVAVGGTVGLEALVGGPLTNASMNPARSIAPAVMSGNLTHLWLYIAAPILGMFLAAPFCRWIQGDDCCFEPDTASETNCTPES